MFITLDRHLARARKKYTFLLNSEQFLEFMMPYLFLSDIPLVEAASFPNNLLSAQLGTLLTHASAEIDDVIRTFLRDGVSAGRFSRKLPPEVSTALNSERFANLREAAQSLDPERRSEVATELAAAVKEVQQQKKVNYFETEAGVVSELRKGLEARERQVEKLQRTVRYWKQQGKKPPARE